MSRDELRKEYFEWLCDFVYDDKRMSRGLSYNRMFSFLFDTPFHWTIPMDENRAADGIDLRYRFGREQNVSDVIVASYLDDRECSMLEMMVYVWKTRSWIIRTLETVWANGSGI